MRRLRNQNQNRLEVSIDTEDSYRDSKKNMAIVATPTAVLQGRPRANLLVHAIWDGALLGLSLPLGPLLGLYSLKWDAHASDSGDSNGGLGNGVGSENSSQGAGGTAKEEVGGTSLFTRGFPGGAQERGDQEAVDDLKACALVAGWWACSFYVGKLLGLCAVGSARAYHRRVCLPAFSAKNLGHHHRPSRPNLVSRSSSGSSTASSNSSNSNGSNSPTRHRHHSREAATAVAAATATNHCPPSPRQLSPSLAASPRHQRGGGRRSGGGVGACVVARVVRPLCSHCRAVLAALLPPSIAFILGGGTATASSGTSPLSPTSPQTTRPPPPEWLVCAVMACSRHCQVLAAIALLVELVAGVGYSHFGGGGDGGGHSLASSFSTGVKSSLFTGVVGAACVSHAALGFAFAILTSSSPPPPPPMPLSPPSPPSSSPSSSRNSVMEESTGPRAAESGRGGGGGACPPSVLTAAVGMRACAFGLVLGSTAVAGLFPLPPPHTQHQHRQQHRHQHQQHPALAPCVACAVAMVLFAALALFRPTLFDPPPTLHVTAAAVSNTVDSVVISASTSTSVPRTRRSRNSGECSEVDNHDGDNGDGSSDDLESNNHMARRRGCEQQQHRDLRYSDGPVNAFECPPAILQPTTTGQKRASPAGTADTLLNPEHKTPRGAAGAEEDEVAAVTARWRLMDDVEQEEAAGRADRAADLSAADEAASVGAESGGRPAPGTNSGLAALVPLESAAGERGEANSNAPSSAVGISSKHPSLLRPGLEWELPPSLSSRTMARHQEGGAPFVRRIMVVPARVLRGCQEDAAEAKRRCAVTALWRRDYRVGDLLKLKDGKDKHVGGTSRRNGDACESTESNGLVATDARGEVPTSTNECASSATTTAVGAADSSSSSAAAACLVDMFEVGEPQPYFNVIKRFYPHYIHGKTHQGHPIYIEQVGVALGNLPSLSERGVGTRQLMRHYTLNQEFMWGVVARGAPEAQAVTIFDLAGITLAGLAGLNSANTTVAASASSSGGGSSGSGANIGSDDGGDREGELGISAVRAVMAVCQAHYMERSHRIFVVNAPFWFAMPWKAISPLLHPNTQKKVSILGVGSFGALFGPESPLKRSDLPPLYGGVAAATARGSRQGGVQPTERGNDDSKAELGHSVEEQGLRLLVDASNARFAASFQENDDKRGDDSRGYYQSVLLPPIVHDRSKNNVNSATTATVRTKTGAGAGALLATRLSTLLSTTASALVSTIVVGSGSGSGVSGEQEGGGEKNTDEGVENRGSRQRGCQQGFQRGGSGERGSGSWGGVGGGGGAVVAHLGRDNRFVYDDLTQRWVMEGSSDSNSDDEDEDFAAVDRIASKNRNHVVVVMDDSDTDDDAGYFSAEMNERDEDDKESFTGDVEHGIIDMANSSSSLSSDLISMTRSTHSVPFSSAPLLSAVSSRDTNGSASPSSSSKHKKNIDISARKQNSVSGGIYNHDPTTTTINRSGGRGGGGSNGGSHAPGGNGGALSTGVLVVYVVWRCLHMACLHASAILIVLLLPQSSVSRMSASSLYHSVSTGGQDERNQNSTITHAASSLPSSSSPLLMHSGGHRHLTTDHAITKTTTAVPAPKAISRGIRMVEFSEDMDAVGSSLMIGGGSLALLLVLLLVSRFAPGVLRRLQSQSLGRTMRAAALLQIAGLLVLLLDTAPSHRHRHGYRQDGGGGSEVRDDKSASGRGGTHEAATMAVGVASYAFLLGAFLVAQAHRKAWVPSLPDCQDPGSLPAWLLTAADALGALLGPMAIAAAATAVTPNQDGGDGFGPSFTSGVGVGAAYVPGAASSATATATSTTELAKALLPLMAIAGWLQTAAAAAFSLCVLSACFQA